MTVRTRVAPSPTGDPHVGTAFIALFNKAFARQHGGQFVLRIEDTDQVRSSVESEQAILGSLNWLGLTWDEGPDLGGPKGPYRQSERSELYQEHAQQLLAKGHAFHCFCTSERLAEVRDQQREQGGAQGYDGHCTQLTAEQVAEKLAAGTPSVVRMRVPTEGLCEFDDMLRGKVSIDYSQIDMQVLLKSDGLPSYHLANVVDDHLMEISHVIRGEEWISSTPKHVLLYQYFGWQMPKFCHLPLLRNADKSKLSKRKNPTSILYFQRIGILAETLVNYLGMMGWSMPDGQEKFSFDEMVANFDLQRVSLGGPVFDLDKLHWLNGRYLREDFDAQQFAQLLKDWALNSSYVQSFLPMIQQRVESLSQVAEMALPFFSGMPKLDQQSFAHAKLSTEQIKTCLQLALWQLESQRSWHKEAIMADINKVAAFVDLKIRDALFGFFVAIMGQASSVSVLEAMVCLGPDLSRARLRHAIAHLGGWSKKELKRLEKDFQAMSQGQ